MASPINDIFTRIVSLSAQIQGLPPDDRLRKKLEREREALRGEAASISVEGRHPESVERQIEAIEKRLESIDSLLIKEGYQERRGGRNIQDPGAYSAAINRLLGENHRDEVQTLTAQLERLRSRSASPDEA